MPSHALGLAQGAKILTQRIPSFRGCIIASIVYYWNLLKHYDVATVFRRPCSEAFAKASPDRLEQLWENAQRRARIQAVHKLDLYNSAWSWSDSTLRYFPIGGQHWRSKEWSQAASLNMFSTWDDAFRPQCHQQQFCLSSLVWSAGMSRQGSDLSSHQSMSPVGGRKGNTQEDLSKEMGKHNAWIVIHTPYIHQNHV